MANIKNFGLVGLGSDVQFGKNGARLIQSEGAFAAKTADNTAFVRFAIANAVSDSEAVTLEQMNAAVAAVAGDNSALQAELDRTQESVGLNPDGSLTLPAGNYLADANTIVDALGALDAAAKAVADATATLDLSVDALETDVSDIKEKDVEQDGRLDIIDGKFVAVEEAHGALVANAIVKNGSVAFTANQSMGNNRLTDLANPVDDGDAISKAYLDGAISNLGNAFAYIGTVNGGADEENAFDLATLEKKAAGSYYKVATAGWFKLGAQTANLHTNDGIVFNTDGGFDHIDNNDAVSRGTAGQIVVEGSVDTGFDISIDGAYTAARQAEVAAEANARAIAITGVENAIAAETLAREQAVTDLEANAVAQQAAIDALSQQVGDDTRITALEANAVAQQAEIDALEAADVAQELRLDGIEANAVAQQTAIDALEANAVAQQAEIDALEDSILNLSQDTIKSTGEKYSVHAADTMVQVANVDADSKLDITLINGEARVAVTSTDVDADLRLVAQGAGQIIIGEEGAGFIQADDTFDMTVAGGSGGGKLNLKGSTVSIQGEDGTDVAKFVSSGASAVKVEATSNAVSFAAEGTEADVDLVFAPKGTGSVDVSNARVVNVANGVNPTDAVNKGQLDSAIADAVVAAEAGHLFSTVATVGAADGTVSLGQVNGTVSRIRVVVLSAYNAGASLTVGTAGTPTSLVSASDVDEGATGIYVVDAAADFANEELLVTISGATAGSAKVYVEYVKA